VYQALIPIEKERLLINVCVCEQFCNKILNAEFKRDKYFVDEVETLIKKKPLRGSQIHEIHYSEDKASNKALVLT
jgi:hypothetical protein